MGGFLFHQIVFGPLQSRRMGSSLGVNLLPLNRKRCSFNCIYCECGWTNGGGDASSFSDDSFPTPEEVEAALDEKLTKMQQGNKRMPDSITFAGNGEPTLHPQFAEVINRTVKVRNRLAPDANIVVLSNGSTLNNPDVFNALEKVNQNIQKLDGGLPETIQWINQPLNPSFDLIQQVEYLSRFNGKVIIQTLFLKGVVDGITIDNTTDQEVEAWIEHLKRIKPQFVMIYPVDRGTAADHIMKVPEEVLRQIADRAEKAGISTRVYY